MTQGSPEEQRIFQKGWDAAIEKAASYLDDAAQDWNRIRDPGMANHCRKHARSIRAFAAPGECAQEHPEGSQGVNAIPVRDGSKLR